MQINALRIESNRKVPQTNQLSLGVLDIDRDFFNDLNRLSNLLNYILSFPDPLKQQLTACIPFHI